MWKASPVPTLFKYQISKIYKTILCNIDIEMAYIFHFLFIKHIMQNWLCLPHRNTKMVSQGPKIEEFQKLESGSALVHIHARPFVMYFYQFVQTSSKGKEKKKENP